MSAIEHRHLRSALEFAVLIAAEGQKRRPPLGYPKELKSMLSSPRLAGGALGKVRRIVEANPDFRTAISAGAVPELVDEVGRLWLAGREGWEDEASAILAAKAADGAASDLRQDLKRAEKRRLAAEQVAARVQADVMARDAVIVRQEAEIDELRADLAKALETEAEVRAELVDTRTELRHTRDREQAALARLEQKAPAVRSDPLPVQTMVDDRVIEGALRAANERIESARAAASEFVAHLDALLDHDTGDVAGGEHAMRSRQEAAKRKPIALPGGVISSSAEAADWLVRAGAPIFVDGYNVAKLGWPDRSLEQQREALISRVENLVRRHGADVTIVFDGSSVVGAHAPARRLVRVVYSPAGVTADDVIRAELARIDDSVPVVVVTNDREIVDDVRVAGASVVPSNAFIAVL